MKSELLLNFDNVLAKEAERISKILLKKYESKVKINMSFKDMVKKTIKEEYEYYFFDILPQIWFYIPNHLAHDPLNEYILVTKEEAVLRHISGYVDWCKKNKEKNHKNKAAKFAHMLIENNKEYQSKNIGLPQLIEETMPILYPAHHDSVDAKALVLCLQDAIENLGYEIEQINPLIIKEKIS